MMPLWGTKTPSAPVGAKSGGDTRAARSLLSCALWRGMGRLWRGMGGGRPPHRQQGLSGFHETRDTAFFESRPLLPFGSPWVREGWRHQKPPSGPLPPPASRCFPVRHCSPLFAIVQQKILPLSQCPLFVRTVNTACLVFTRHGLCCGAAWGGYGAAWAATVPRTGNTGLCISRITRHESRPFWY